MNYTKLEVVELRANSRIRINNGRLRQLTQASIRVLEQTAEVLHTEEVQAQVMPFDTGNLQNDSNFVDTEQSSKGTVSLVNATPYARRLYYHPEYELLFDEKERKKLDAMKLSFNDFQTVIMGAVSAVTVVDMDEVSAKKED